MKYCVPYFKYFDYMKEVDEMIVPFHKEDIGFLKSLTSMPELTENKTIIIEIHDPKDFYSGDYIGIFKELKEKYSDTIKFKLLLSFDLEQIDFYQQMKEHEIEFFFSDLVRDWDTLHGFIDLGVSDVYIVEELGFSLNKIGAVAHAKSVSVRVFGNIAQSAWPGERSIKSFFIRPEDVPIYEPYVDVIQFLSDTRESYETLYKIYAVKKYWFGALKDLIKGLNCEVDNKTIIPAYFGTPRLGCGKKCLSGGKCRICDRVLEAGAVLEEREMYFKY